MSNTISLIKNVFGKYNISVHENVDDMAFLKLEIKNNPFVNSGIAIDFEDNFILYLEINKYAPENVRKDLGEWLSDINYGMLNGNFETDSRIGAVRHKFGILYQGTKINEALIENIVVQSLENIEMWGENILEKMKL